MKTAMQELFDEMTSINWHLYSYEDKIKIINVHLEKEKEQIIESYENGKQNGMESIINANAYIIGEYYYNQTYNQNK